MTYVDLLPEIRTSNCGNPYVKLRSPVRQTAEIRTSNCGAPYVKLRKSVRQTAEPRTSNCGAPYPKLPGLFIGTGGAVAPLGSGLLAGIVP